jgi:ferredoxin
MDLEKPMDEHLKEYVDKYAQWRKTGNFTVSSRVIPVQESFQPEQWVMPSDQVLTILKDSRSFALIDCVCRTHYNRCNKPKDVCMLTDDLADKAVSAGKAQRITLSEASERLKEADKHGLIHMTLYMPGHKIYALCSCCGCCCHDLQLLLNYKRTDLVARSDYLAETNNNLCTACGLCIERCVFGARKITDDTLSYESDRCLGCGLCVSVCPKQATVMRKRT